MPETHKLSLWNAILININIMLGSGIFINTVLLTKQAGSLGAAVYALVGILILPLILGIAQLLKHHNAGGGTFYHFGALVHPYLGFLSSWSYFIAKLATCALGVHVCISLLQQIIPALQIIPTVLFDCIIISIFTMLNMLNLSIGKSIQYCFMGLKLVPISFAIFVGLFLITGANFTSSSLIWSGIPASIPFVLYAFSGFEASCSLSSAIQDPEKNGPKAILISYMAVICIVMLYQLMFFGSLGSYLGTLLDYKQAFPAFLQKLIPHSENAQNFLTAILHIGIASSSLGASYGIMYSNSWNLYTLAQHDHIFEKKCFITLNKHHVPYLCIFIEGLLAVVYLLLTQGQQIPLQQVSAFGSVIAYSISSIALLMITYRNLKNIKATPLLSVASCILLFGSLIWSIISNGITPLLILFISMIIAGSLMFIKQSKTIK